MPGGVILGFDPGGIESFGWSVLRDATAAPLRLVESGVANSPSAAVEAALQASKGRLVLAAGIDSPLFWSAAGDRIVDKKMRRALLQLGVPGAARTVMPVNALRGACLVGGLMAAKLLRRRTRASLPLPEPHPQALLCLPQCRALGD